MDFGNLLLGGTLIGVLASCWKYVRSLIWRGLSTFLQRVEFHGDTGPEILLDHLLKNYKYSKVYDRVYGLYSGRVASQNDRYGFIPFERLGLNLLIFWRGWWPLIYSTVEKKSAAAKPSASNGTETDDQNKARTVLIFIRGTFDFNKIHGEATKAFNDRCWSYENQTNGKFRRFSVVHAPSIANGTDAIDLSRGSTSLPWFHFSFINLLAYGVDELQTEAAQNGPALDALFFPKNVVGYIEEIRRWRNSREWYTSRRIPWTRGWLLYGPPGTGKSCLARAFAEDLDLPLVVFSLGDLTNREFKLSWSQLQHKTPCIVLFEDFDNVFHGRNNISPQALAQQQHISVSNATKAELLKNGEPSAASNGPVMFDTLINQICGADRHEGIFLIITTNDPSKLDEALASYVQRGGSWTVEASRPGRIDRAIKLDYMTNDDKHRLARHIVRDDEGALVEIMAHIEQNLQETPAQFQNYCSLVAQRRYWNEHQLPGVKHVESEHQRTESNHQPIEESAPLS